MKTQCSICSELFEPASTIAAVPCGHTFHDHCIMQWLSGYGHNCPQCRVKVNDKRIIHKLYFDQADDDGDESDYGKLRNDLDNARLSLKEKDKQRVDIVEEKDKISTQLEAVLDSKKAIEKMYRDEKMVTAGLRKEMVFYKREKKEADTARDEAKWIRKKLQTMKAVENMVNSVEGDVKEIIGSSGDPKQLATWCAVLKKELNTKRQDTRSVKDELEKVKRELHFMKKQHNEKETQLKVAKDQIKVVEDDFKSLESENISLKKKMESLTKAIGSPNGTAESFAHRLLHESPAPMPNSKRPRLSLPEEGDFDLDITADLFDTSVASESPSVQRKKDCKEFGTHYVKITSAASASSVVKKQKREVQDISNIPGLGQMNLFKKKSGFGGGQSSLIKQGYNGLGSHEKFIQPSGKPLKFMPKKKSVTNMYKAPPVRKIDDKPPPLPTLANFS